MFQIFLEATHWKSAAILFEGKGVNYAIFLHL